MGRKRDSLMGTLEADAVYLTFKEQLQAEALENSRTTNKQHYFETESNNNFCIYQCCLQTCGINEYRM